VNNGKDISVQMVEATNNKGEIANEFKSQYQITIGGINTWAFYRTL
jgi:hypothetical protein